MKNPWKGALAALIAVCGIAACTQPKAKEHIFPVLGNPTIKTDTLADGTVKKDTIPHMIPAFSFTDQDGQTVTEATFSGKYYLADFFFTKCPTICPKVKRNMLKIYEKFAADNNLLLLSHSIDTRYDTVATLHQYANNLGIETRRWHLVTGTRDAIYGMAEIYMATALEDPSSPGGYAHSGYVALVDPQRRIRGLYDGTDDKAMSKLTEDLDYLLGQKIMDPPVEKK